MKLIARYRMRVQKNLLIILLPVLAMTGIAIANDVVLKVISSGAVRANSARYNMYATTGQTLIEPGSLQSSHPVAGFWPGYMILMGSRCRPGDTNNDGSYDILDIVYLINYLYKHGPPPIPDARCSGDANCGCTVGILDIVYLIDSIYQSGSAPCSYSGWKAACIR